MGYPASCFRMNDLLQFVCIVPMASTPLHACEVPRYHSSSHGVLMVRANLFYCVVHGLVHITASPTPNIAPIGRHAAACCSRACSLLPCNLWPLCANVHSPGPCLVHTARGDTATRPTSVRYTGWGWACCCIPTLCFSCRLLLEVLFQVPSVLLAGGLAVMTSLA
jgi:hypothetical protein